LSGKLFLGPQGTLHVTLASLAEADELRNNRDGFCVTHISPFESPKLKNWIPVSRFRCKNKLRLIIINILSLGLKNLADVYNFDNVTVNVYVVK
jgi:hypothetical protein